MRRCAPRRFARRGRRRVRGTAPSAPRGGAVPGSPWGRAWRRRCGPTPASGTGGRGDLRLPSRVLPRGVCRPAAAVVRAEFVWQGEGDRLLRGLDGFDLVPTVLGEVPQDLLDEGVGSRGARGDSD